MYLVKSPQGVIDYIGRGFACTSEELPHEIACHCKYTFGYYPVGYLCLPVADRGHIPDLRKVYGGNDVNWRPCPLRGR